MQNYTRSDYTQAQFNIATWRILLIEIIFISSFAGIFFSEWYIFGATFLFLTLITISKFLSIVLNIILSSIWGLFAAVNTTIVQGINFFTGDLIQSLEIIFSTPPSQILGILFFLIGYILHASSIESIRDVFKGLVRQIPGYSFIKKIITVNRVRSY